MEHPFVLLNVFAVEGRSLSGNPLCVFERGEPFGDAEMLALARQFNLSETTFVCAPSSANATAHVRIFTPSFEMPFAGHPTLGTAHVVRARAGTGDRVVLEMKAGLVEVIASGDEWTLRAARAPETRAPTGSREELAAMLGLESEAIGEDALWVDTGSDQLVVPLRSVDDVRAAKPVGALLERFGFSAKRGSSLVYVWAPIGPDEVEARFFFLSGGGVVEDPATGSACANLGGWMLATNRALPLTLRVHQGAAVARPSLLGLHVDADRHIYVSGRVEEVGRGTFTLAVR